MPSLLIKRAWRRFLFVFELILELMLNNRREGRNITSQQRDYLLGLRYRQEKKTQGGDRKSQKSSDQNEHLKTAEKIATQHNVTEKTVRRAEKFADGVDKIAAAMPFFRTKTNAFFYIFLLKSRDL